MWGIKILVLVCFGALTPHVSAQQGPEICSTLQSWETRSSQGEKGNPDFYIEQVATIHQWLVSDPNNARLWALLGSAYEAHGYSHAQLAAKQQQDLRENLATIFAMQDDYKSAVSILFSESGKEAGKLSDTDKQFQQRRLSAALAATQNAIRHNDKLAYAYILKGSINTKQENFSAAEQSLQKGINLASTPSLKILASFALVEVLEKTGQDTSDLQALILQQVVEAGGIEKLEDSVSYLLFPQCNY